MAIASFCEPTAAASGIPEVGVGAAGHTLADGVSHGGDEEDEHFDHDHEASATPARFAYFAVSHRFHAFVHSTPL